MKTLKVDKGLRVLTTCKCVYSGFFSRVAFMHLQAYMLCTVIHWNMIIFLRLCTVFMQKSNQSMLSLACFRLDDLCIDHLHQNGSAGLILLLYWLSGFHGSILFATVRHGQTNKSLYVMAFPSFLKVHIAVRIVSVSTFLFWMCCLCAPKWICLLSFSYCFYLNITSSRMTRWEERCFSQCKTSRKTKSAFSL